MWHVWLDDEGEEVASIDDETHRLLAAQFEMKDLGVRDGVHYWRAIEEVNYDPEDEAFRNAVDDE